MHDFEMDGIGRVVDRSVEKKMLLKSELLMKSVNLLLVVDIFIYNPNIGKD